MKQRLTRRGAIKTAVAASTLPWVHIRTGRAAGRVSVALWDHWVPAGSALMRTIIEDWAKKNQVEVELDFLTSIGDKIRITMAAEALGKTGHDVYAFDQWTVHQYSDDLEVADGVVNRLIGKYGKVAAACEYLAKIKGHWMAVPVAWGSAPLPPCGRISLIKQHAGIDVTKWYPAEPTSPEASKDWTYDTQLKIAEATFKAGLPIGLGCGSGSTDANQTWGATFAAFGANLVDGKGKITIDSDGVMAAMEYCQKIIKFMPAEAISWDDASNNRALLAGKTALIWNPPSAWAVAKRDAPQIAADLWTFPNPAGPKGRFVPYRPYFWGIWKFAKNKSPGWELIEYLSQREIVEKIAAPTAGYDIPPFLSMSDFKVWAEVEPPKGTIYNYPIRPWHNAEYYIPGSSAPPEVAVQIWSRSVMPSMVARLMSGASIKQVLAWAKEEVEGYL